MIYISIEREEKPKLRKPKVVKEQEHIDFLSTEPIDVNVLFAKSSASITLPKNDKNRSDHLLPDDMHFSSKDLLKLFSNSQFPVRLYSNDSHFRLNSSDRFHSAKSII